MSPRWVDNMRIVVALGGNALLRRGEPLTIANQNKNVKNAARALSSLIDAGHSIVITHGNGPQVGLLALQARANSPDDHFPIDILDAESAGMIGYMLLQELSNLLKDSLLATLLTRILVDRNDPAFRRPTKPIGPFYEEKAAKDLALRNGWNFAPDKDGWRRVVASPEPKAILDTEVLSLLIENGVIVICAGGGGIPVVEFGNGQYEGVEAVVDKDRVSALLALTLNADFLLLLTDVKGVFRNWGTAEARLIERVATDAIEHTDYAEGSMGPKVAAAVEFVKTSGKSAAIGMLEDASDIISGRAGTLVHPANGAWS